MTAPRGRRERGIALIVTILAVGALSAIGLALSLASALDRLASANHDRALALLNAADAALAVAARDLAALDDWSAALDGTRVGSVADGPPAGTRQPFPGLALDLTWLTAQLTCGRAGPCTDAAVRTATLERPWGANNPRWVPFLYGAFTALQDPLHPTPPYLVVWLGDDGAEGDGDVRVDGGGPEGEGRYIVRARAEAFGPAGGRRAIEAELCRLCSTTESGERACRPGVRIHGWRLVTPVS